MRQRKGGQRQVADQPADAAAKQPPAAALPPSASKPKPPADAIELPPPSSAKQPAKAATPQQPSSERPAPAALLAVAAALALLLLAAAQQAAVRLLAPQTGEWLAGSFCSLALFALALVAAVAGHTAEQTRELLGAGSLAAAAWWAAAAAALADAGLHPELLAGRLLLAPGLAGAGGRRLTDQELTLRCMALAAAALGPLFCALGAAFGACGGRAAAGPLGSGARPLALLLPALAGTAAAAMGGMLPAAALLPRPGANLLPLIGAAAAVAAAALAPRRPPATSSRRKRQAGKRSSSSGSSGTSGSSSSSVLAAAAALAIAAALLGAANQQPCGPASRELEGGQYRVLWECAAAGGGWLSVVEGTYKETYRYRLLRLDHSVMGGQYVAPPDVAGQSIYTAFYLQSAAAVLAPGGARSLHVGLGVGSGVQALQRLGVAADVLELHPEVIAAAKAYFGLKPALHGGRALAGDAAALVPRLAAEAAAPGGRGFDYILHDVFSGGGIAAPLMSEAFFRQLGALLAPGGVLAVNYWGDRGPGLKAAYCRLRLAVGSVRAFSDLERSRVRNHVLFASQTDLAAANISAGIAAAQARAQAQAQDGSARAAGGEGALDPQQLRVWGALEKQEVHFTFNRQRCEQLLQQEQGGGGPPGPRSNGSSSRSGGAGGGPSARGPLGGLGSRPQQQQQQALRRQPWVWRKVKALRERHSHAVASWVALRTQFGDAFWTA